MASVGARGEHGFPRRSRVQRRRPIEVRGRLLELSCRARCRLPSATRLPAQHVSPHDVSAHIVRRNPHDLRRQRFEPLVVPPLRLGHLGALRKCQLVEGPCRGLCPAHRLHRIALRGLEEPLCGGFHFVKRPVQLPRLRVRRAVVAAEVRGRRGGGGLGLTLLLQRLQRLQRHADLLSAPFWLLLPQLGDQRLDAEVGVSHSQGTYGLEEQRDRRSASFDHPALREPATQKPCDLGGTCLVKVALY